MIFFNFYVLYLFILFSLIEEELPHHSSLVPTPEIPDIVSMPSRFEKKQESGCIDVWWLYDDGGE